MQVTSSPRHHVRTLGSVTTLDDHGDLTYYGIHGLHHIHTMTSYRDAVWGCRKGFVGVARYGTRRLSIYRLGAALSGGSLLLPDRIFEVRFTRTGLTLQLDGNQQVVVTYQVLRSWLE